MNRRFLLFLVAVFFFGFILAKHTSTKEAYQSPQENQFSLLNSDIDFEVKPPEPEPQTPSTPEPTWTDHQPVRNISNLGKVLSDIESHMPAGHIYKDSDKVTWAHETTHGINSNIRNKHQTWLVKLGLKSSGRINGFYCLNNRAAVITEPNTTIGKVASIVPKSLRGDVYNLYLVQQASSWGDTPLYICDEWVAYINGAECRQDLGIKDRGETVQYAMEFVVYSTCIAQSSQTNDEQLKKFLMWNSQRIMDLYKKAENVEPAKKYWEKVINNSDADNFRQFARTYYGPEWTKELLGF